MTTLGEVKSIALGAGDLIMYYKPALRNGPFVAGLAPGAFDFRADSG